MDQVVDRQSSAPLTLPEAAKYLGYAENYVHKLTSLGKIPFYKPMGGRLFFKKEDLDNFLFRGRRAADYEVKEREEAALVGGQR